MASQASYRRVGIFMSEEHYVLQDNEWFRDTERSSKPLPNQINEFLAGGLEVVYVSSPTMQLVSREPNHCVYRLACSIIYVPAEIIKYAGINEQTYSESSAAGNQAGESEPSDVEAALAAAAAGPSVSIPLPYTSEDIFAILGESLARTSDNRLRRKQPEPRPRSR